MRIHYLQHIEIEDPGSIVNWAEERKHSLSATKLYKNEIFPEPESFDWLLIMGGPMSVNDEAGYPWLKKEKAFIKMAIDAGKTVIGICLGAQLIAASLGSRVRKNDVKEIGWFPLSLTAEALASPVFSHLKDTIDAFHWHGETLDLPKGAVRIAGSEACVNQAFAIKPNVFGFQFHLETTEKGARDFIREFADELVDAPFIQSAGAMLSPPSRFDGINNAMAAILDQIERL